MGGLPACWLTMKQLMWSFRFRYITLKLLKRKIIALMFNIRDPRPGLNRLLFRKELMEKALYSCLSANFGPFVVLRGKKPFFSQKVFSLDDLS